MIRFARAAVLTMVALALFATAAPAANAATSSGVLISCTIGHGCTRTTPAPPKGGGRHGHHHRPAARHHARHHAHRGGVRR